MDQHKEESESLLGVTIDELRVASVTHQHRDGTIESRPLEESPTEKILAPQTWEHPKTRAITEKRRQGLTRAEHVARSLKVEAALVMITGSEPVDEERLKRHAFPALKEVFKAMGWEDMIVKSN